MALEKILILYDGSDAADRLLVMACETVWTTGRVMPLYLMRVPPTLPLTPLPHWYDHEAQRALDRAEALAWRYGREADTWLVHSREPVDAIASVARDCEADVIFLPLCGWRHPVRHIQGALQAQAVARRAPCPVLTGAWAVPEGESHPGEEAANLPDPLPIKEGATQWSSTQGLRCRLIQPARGGTHRMVPTDISC